MAENTNYDELLKKLGLTDEAAIKSGRRNTALTRPAHGAQLNRRHMTPTEPCPIRPNRP